ncbi:YqaJ viral recombinase family protein [Chitinophaga agrisoli]|uniref:YqaJ viral recombinase family protein n=1 Tax=Chitinophaga agrisoli TaxID=2607653 RepID=A0A5B2VXB9_9BACT|nr:lambda exonuclease family protein [Chitinophaga agrisoli]KAA2242846.1 YqaJ viral recombinase family protein [Chitinophaga agrisoli]
MTPLQAVETWKAERIGKFTASDIHKLMQSGKKKDEYFGTGALTYIYETVAEVITGEVPEVTAKAIEWGWANEYDAILEYEKRMNVPVNYYGSGQPKFVLYNEVAGGSPDGEVGLTTLVEVKCPYNSGNHIKFLNMETQEQLKKDNFDYYCQTQMNLLCTNRELAHFISYDPRVIDHRLRLAILDVKRDEELITEIKARISAATLIVKSLLSKLAI